MSSLLSYTSRTTHTLSCVLTSGGRGSTQDIQTPLMLGLFLLEAECSESHELFGGVVEVQGWRPHFPSVFRVVSLFRYFSLYICVDTKTIAHVHNTPRDHVQCRVDRLAACSVREWGPVAIRWRLGSSVDRRKDAFQMVSKRVRESARFSLPCVFAALIPPTPPPLA